MDFVKDFTIAPGDKSTVTIQGEIPFSQLESERKTAIKRLGENIELDGFRKGHVPEKMLVEKIGEARILSEMAERALAKVYPEVIKHHKIDAVGYPQIEVTKLAPQNPLGFKATVAVLPDITLPDYKALTKTVNESRPKVEVTDEDVDNQIKDIMRQKAAYERLQNKAATPEKTADEDAKKDLGDVTELPTPESQTKKEEEASEPNLDDLTDEFVQGLGQPGQFSDVADFKQKLREHLKVEKEHEATGKHRAAITDAIVEAATLELPDVLIQSEQQQMFAQMEDELTRAELKMEDYLKHIKKTKEELFAEWKPAAEKRAKLQLILNEIAKQENIKPDEAELKQRVDQLMTQYKDADEARVRVYVGSVLTNEAVMKMLESVK